MKIIFFGSDEFSIAALRACVDSGNAIPLILTTPPQKKGRGLKLLPTPVQEFADKKGIPCIAPDKLKDPEVIGQVRGLDPDLFVVSSYGKYIPSDYLTIPSRVCLNVHPSLVPRYRGSGPIQWALLNGDRETGVSIIEVSKKLDAGDIFDQVSIPIEPRDDHLSLRAKLAHLSYEMLLNLILEVPHQPLKRRPQDDEGEVYARKLTKEDGRTSFTESAVTIEQKVRALKPWPGTFIELDGSRLALLEAEASDESPEHPPGTLVAIRPDGSMAVAAGKGIIILKQVQPAGKKPMTGAAFANGKRLKTGSRLPAQ